MTVSRGGVRGLLRCTRDVARTRVLCVVEGFDNLAASVKWLRPKAAHVTGKPLAVGIGATMKAVI